MIIVLPSLILALCDQSDTTTTVIITNTVFGSCSSQGATISISGSADVTDCTFRDLTSSGSGSGFFFSNGQLTVVRCTFQRNRAATSGSAFSAVVRKASNVTEVSATLNTARHAAIFFGSGDRANITLNYINFTPDVGTA
jgi:hypothetical protein